MSTPTPMITLERYIVSARPRALSPFRWTRGGWVTNAKRVRVRRVKGRGMAVAVKEIHGYASLLTAAELDFVRKVAKRRGWILTVNPGNLHIERYPYLDGDLDCSPDLLRRLNAVGKELGKTIFVRSGLRTMQEQWDLYNRYGSPRAAYPNPNAPHVRGIAADAGIDGRDIGEWPGARAAMRRHGLSLRVPGEDWHVEVGSTWNA